MYSRGRSYIKLSNYISDQFLYELPVKNIFEIVVHNMIENTEIITREVSILDYSNCIEISYTLVHWDEEHFFDQVNSFISLSDLLTS